VSNEDKFVIEKNKNTNRRIIIRTTDEMADEIFNIAKENGVSVNNLLISCIRYALDHR
jgi:predicted HicB family RNase H-like nuclease